MITHSDFPSFSIRICDSDGEFLLIEATFHLPCWLNPDTAPHSVFLRNSYLHIVPKNRLPNLSLLDSLKFLINFGPESQASNPVQRAMKTRLSDYPKRARMNMHRVRVRDRVPVSMAQVLKHEACLISLVVEGFYDRDIDTMKFAMKMERFLGKGKDGKLVLILVKMSRVMYAQLVQQAFRDASWLVLVVAQVLWWV